MSKFTSLLNHCEICQQGYLAAFDEARTDVRENIPFNNPYDPEKSPLEFAKNQGYHDGFRSQCFRERLSFPSCNPLYRSPLPKEI